MPDEPAPIDNPDDDDLFSATPPFAPNFDPAAWRNVCESFIDPLIEELERWLQRRPPAHSGTDITDWLVDLTYSLHVVAIGIGNDTSMKRWSRAKVELEATVSVDFADRLETRIKDMFKETESMIAKFRDCPPEYEFAVIEPFLGVTVEEFLTYLDSCSRTLRSKFGETTDHHPPSGAKIETQKLDDTLPSGKRRRERKRPPRLHLSSWQDAQAELEILRMRGAQWQSLKYYADEFDCGISTIKKCIEKGSVELQNWSKRERNSPTVDATPFGEHDLAELTPAKNTDPIESIIDDTERDLIESVLAFSPGHREAIQGMSEAAQAELAQEILKMPPHKRRKLLEIYQHDPESDEQEYLWTHPEPPMK